MEYVWFLAFQFPSESTLPYNTPTSHHKCVLLWDASCKDSQVDTVILNNQGLKWNHSQWTNIQKASVGLSQRMTPMDGIETIDIGLNECLKLAGFL